MKKLKTWAIVILLFFTFTLCPIIQTYASMLDTSGETNTESEESQAEEGAETRDNTALFDSRYRDLPFCYFNGSIHRNYHL